MQYDEPNISRSQDAGVAHESGTPVVDQAQTAAGPNADGGDMRPGPASLTVVVPVYNEAEALPALLDRLAAVLIPTGIPFDVVAVDDRSTDHSFAILCELRDRYPWLRIIRFSRNFGKEIALAAGLRAAGGAVVVQMDADLQHPPELIHRFLVAWQEGAELIYAARDRKAERGGLRDGLSRLFYAVFDRVAEIQLMRGSGDFVLFDRKVVDALNALPERNRFGKGLYAWVGFERRAIPYHPDARLGGRTSWTLRGLFGLAVAGLTAFSVLPLRIWSGVGAIISLLSIGYGLMILVQTLLFGADMPGYPSIMVGIAFLGGIQLVTLGVIGEYLGQVFMEVKGRPLYVIDRTVGFEAAATKERTDADPPGPSQPT